MGILSSFSITSQILNISLDICEPSLIQGVRFDSTSNTIVDNITGKVIFDLKDPSVLFVSEDMVLIKKPSLDVSFLYQLNKNNTVTRLSHLYIKQVDKRDVIINKNNKSYLNILKNLPKEYTKGIFVNLDGTFELLSNINWDEFFSKFKEGD